MGLLVPDIEFPLLAGLDESERSQLFAAAEPRRYGRREVVFHEGDPGDTLHLVLSGRLAVRVTTPLGDVATLSVLGAGQSFGELALIDPDGQRTATVVALEPTRTLALRRSALLALREQHPAFDRFLLGTLAAQVRRLSSMVLEALYLPVEQRIGRQLAYLARVYGGETGRAEIRLTQDDIAGAAGTTRATANRVLRALEARGAIVLARGRIVVLDRAGLDGGRAGP
ncbi:MAG: Crp/Fnr family transcriptional regulator [Actinomycetota bacterium]|nr:Crp/Fnr family transcriptional regulator [Actinomycetota bacterium]